MNKNLRTLLLGIVIWTVAWGQAFQVRAGDWMKLEGCQLMANPANDGDSFYVRHDNTVYIFRLYGVDTPETQNTYPDRVAAQAKYFNIDPDDALKVGLLAERWTKKALSRPFTVETCKQDAMGNSHLPRYYAVITTAKGENLAEGLAAAGLARVYGMTPSGGPADFSQSRLEKLGREAQRKHLGGFASRQSREAYVAASDSEETTGTGGPAVPAPGSGNFKKLNVNTATEAELVALPGIGPVFASRIIARRPLTKIEQLADVQGIGPVMMERFSQYLEVPGAPQPAEVRPEEPKAAEVAGAGTGESSAGVPPAEMKPVEARPEAPKVNETGDGAATTNTSANTTETDVIPFSVAAPKPKQEGPSAPAPVGSGFFHRPD